MMMFTAIMKTEPGGRVTKFQDFREEADALAHVEKFKAIYPDAFVAPKRNENILDWKVNGKSVAIEKRPPKPPRPEPEDLAVKVKALEARLTALENPSNGVR